jgi:hypothetical protein
MPILGRRIRTGSSAFDRLSEVWMVERLRGGIAWYASMKTDRV